MILDATIINAPSSTKNKAKERDPEMHSVAKRKQWFFGMCYHIEVDATSGLVHSVESTAANVHELNTAAVRLHRDERLIYGDAATSATAAWKLFATRKGTISRTAKLSSELR